MEKLLFKTEEFEGPLDLMLHLIAKHKLDIYNIQISALLEQYVAYIRQMPKTDLETASEFLEMASRLVHIKTVSLLPKHESEASQLRAELQGQLLEYHVCKLAAQRLGEQNNGNVTFVHPGELIPADRTYTLTHKPQTLLRAYLDAAGKKMRRMPPSAKAFTGIVARRVVSVSSRIIHLMRRLYKGGKTSYDSLFETSGDRSELVATFLALLDLVFAGRVVIEGGQVALDNQRRTKRLAVEEDAE